MERTEAIKYAKAICYCRGCGHYVYPIDESDGTDYCEECEHKEFWDKAIEALSEAPRMHGHWIDEGPYSKELGGTLNGFIYKCSCCENAFIAPYKFCPGCGAKMDGEQ